MQQQQQQQPRGVTLESAAREAERLYTREDILQKARLISSEYKKTVMEIIDLSSFTMRAKLSYANIVSTLFDQNAILARNDNIEVRVLRARLALNFARIAMSKTDVLNPMVVSIDETIIQHFRDYISRSAGGLEGLLQHRNINTIEQTPTPPSPVPGVSVQQPQYNQPQQPQRRGILFPRR